MKIKISFPSIGAIRIRKGFLLIPKQINGEFRWLEIATWKEEYGEFPNGWSDWGWKAIGWVDEN